MGYTGYSMERQLEDVLVVPTVGHKQKPSMVAAMTPEVWVLQLLSRPVGAPEQGLKVFVVIENLAQLIALVSVVVPVVPYPGVAAASQRESWVARKPAVAQPRVPA